MLTEGRLLDFIAGLPDLPDSGRVDGAWRKTSAFLMASHQCAIHCTAGKCFMVPLHHSPTQNACVPLMTLAHSIGL